MHLDGGDVECAPDTTEVIADIFAKGDCSGILVTSELCFHEAATEGDDCAG